MAATNNPILTETDLAYLAGLFDGEGYAGISKSSHKYTSKRKDGSERVIGHRGPLMSIGMCDPDPVRFFGLCFGGGCSHSKAPSQARIVYKWSVSYRKAQSTAIALLPYLKNEAKVTQVQRILDHYVTL